VGWLLKMQQQTLWFHQRQKKRASQVAMQV
jgi:hypothetical protein